MIYYNNVTIVLKFGDRKERQVLLYMYNLIALLREIC